MHAPLPHKSRSERARRRLFTPYPTAPAGWLAGWLVAFFLQTKLGPKMAAREEEGHEGRRMTHGAVLKRRNTTGEHRDFFARMLLGRCGDASARLRRCSFTACSPWCWYALVGL